MCTTVTFNIDNTTNTVDANNTEKPVIYPNPVSDKFRISNYQYVSSIEIYDSLGRLVKIKSHTESEDHYLNCTNGLYFIILRDQEGNNIGTSKIASL